MDIEYRKIRITKSNSRENKEYLDDLVKLSVMWEKEKCTPSYYANKKKDYLDKDLYVAINSRNRIIGYGFGHIKVLDKKTSYNKKNEKAFEIDELYVSKRYRNKQIGQSLFKMMQEDNKGKVSVVELIATSHKHNELLHFYIDELGMSFNHALLVKRI